MLMPLNGLFANQNQIIHVHVTDDITENSPIITTCIFVQYLLYYVLIHIHTLITINPCITITAEVLCRSN